MEEAPVAIALTVFGIETFHERSIDTFNFVAIALTVFGIETAEEVNSMFGGSTVAIALTVFGIETILYTLARKALSCNSTYRFRY